MLPPIRYAASDDGVLLAYLREGDGVPALIISDPLFTDLERYWPVFRRAAEPAGGFEQLNTIYFSPRGFGLSDRDVEPPSIDRQLLDIDTILVHAGEESVALLAPGNAGTTAVLYAAARPERVRSLVLFNYWSNRSDWRGPLSHLLETNWELYTVLIGQVVAGKGDPGGGAEVTAIMQASGSGPAYHAWLATNASVDLREYLPRITAPTLVMCRKEIVIGSYSLIDRARRLASGIPDARLALLPGDAYAIDQGVIREAVEFVTKVERDRAREGAAPR